MTIVQLTLKVKENYRKSKSILKIVSTPKFKELYYSASLADQELLINYINNGNKEAIINWIIKTSGDIPIMKLRRLAKEYAIKNYNRLTSQRLMIKLQFYLTIDQIIERLI